MRGLRWSAGLTVVALCVSVPAASAAIPAPPSEWYGLPGLGAASGATWVRALAHSTPPNTVYAGVENGGAFRSTNGGTSWEAFNAGFPSPATTSVRALVTTTNGVDVYAGTNTGVWKSSGGGPWAPLGQGTLNAPVESLLALPGDVLLAGAPGGVWRSADGGQTWTPPAPGNGMPWTETPAGLAAQPTFVSAATTNGVFRSTDAGTTWSLSSDGIPAGISPTQAWVDTHHPDRIYASTAVNGVYRSTNGGVTWAPANNGLGAVRARALQIFTAAPGARLYAATEDGLWYSLSRETAGLPPPEWGAVTQEGLAQGTSMWALTAPVIPGAGALGLIAGTETGGGYFLSFEPPDSPCPTSHTTNVTANCPRLNDTTPTEAQQLSLNGNGNWSGTGLIDHSYQWQACSGVTENTCQDIPDAEESTFVVPPDSISRYRVEVTATNPAPTFDLVFRYSAISGTVGSTVNFPGATAANPPTISVTPSDNATEPRVGDSLYAEYGTAPSASSDGWFNPQATSVAFQWLRCDDEGSDCNEIPGATARTYTLAIADGTHQLRVRVRGTNANGTRELTSPASFDVISGPAAVADPITDPDGGPARSQAPALVGYAFTGHSLAGTVGGWKDPTTEFSRVWLRCDAGGAACTPLSATGPAYLIGAEDVGHTLRMRVRADVNGDLGDNGADNSPPAAVEVETAPSAVVTAAPGGSLPDTIAPVVSGLNMTKRKFAVAKGRTPVSARASQKRKARRKRVAKGTKFRFRLSEAGTAVITIERLLPGRKVGRKCRKPTRGNRKRKRCKRAARTGRLTRGNLQAGGVTVPFTGRIGRKKLKRGSYRGTVVVSDAAGNASRPAKVGFKVVP